MKKTMTGTVTLDLATYNEMLRRMDTMERAISITEDYWKKPRIEVNMKVIKELITEKFEEGQQEGLFEEFYIDKNELSERAEIYTSLFKQPEVPQE